MTVFVPLWYFNETIDVHLFVNEILLLIVGLGIAFLMNLIMPSLDGTLKHFKKQIEDQYTQIFETFSEKCKVPNQTLNIPFDDLQLTCFNVPSRLGMIKFIKKAIPKPTISNRISLTNKCTSIVLALKTCNKMTQLVTTPSWTLNTTVNGINNNTILILGSVIFSLLGQNAVVLGLIVLLFIPLTVVFKVQEGVVTSCVILLHVFNAKTIDV